MKHIVERILDGLPVYIQEDFPRFVELLRAYYTWQASPDKALGILYGHDDLLDIDHTGMLRSIEELGEEAVPQQYRRAWKMFARNFNASRGSVESWHNFFSIFYNEDVIITDGSQAVLQPSAARVERYKRCIVKTTQTIPRSGILLQATSSATADIVEASLIAQRGIDRYYELTVKPRTRTFYPGSVRIVTPTGVVPCEFACFQRFNPLEGQSYQPGDIATVSTALVTTRGIVGTLTPAIVTSLGVSVGGTQYRQGDVISLPGCRGFRGEVASVSETGSILTARVINKGDPYGGDVTFVVDSVLGEGATITFAGSSGRPLTLEFDIPIWGDVETFSIASPTGTGIQASWEQYVFEDVVVKTGFNGVIGIGSRITDSAAWMDSSYTVTTAVGQSEWKEFASTMLHQPGRYMNAVKAVRGDVIVPGTIATANTTSSYSTMSAEVSVGEETAADTLTS